MHHDAPAELAGTKGQRALVVLSDGDDNSSAITSQNAVEYARRSGTVVFTIGLDLPASAETIFADAIELAVTTEALDTRPTSPSGGPAAFVYRGLCGKLWVPPPAVR